MLLGIFPILATFWCLYKDFSKSVKDIDGFVEGDCSSRGKCEGLGMAIYIIILCVLIFCMV